MLNNLKKNFIWNTIGSTIYSFSSLILLIIVTRINGVKEAGIFTFAFSFACMIQVIGTYSGRTYQVTDRNKEIQDYDYIYQRIFTCILMFLVAFVFVIVKGYNLFKLEVILLLILYRIIDAFSEIYYGIFQKNNCLYKVGISLFLRSFFGLLVFFIIDYFTNNLILSIIMLNIINILVFICYDYINFRKYSINKTNINLERIKKLFIGGFFVFIFTFLIQYVSSATKYAIDDLLTEEYQTIFGIILMPSTFISLCSQLVIQPFLVSINKMIAKENYKQLKKQIFNICLSIILIGIFAEICCYFLGIPVLNVLYGIDLSDYLNPLLIIIAGSILFGVSSVLSACLIALRKNKIQTIIYIIISIITTVISYILVGKLNIIGASFAYFITMLLLLLLYLNVFLHEFKTTKK